MYIQPIILNVILHGMLPAYMAFYNHQCCPSHSIFAIIIYRNYGQTDSLTLLSIITLSWSVSYHITNSKNLCLLFQGLAHAKICLKSAETVRPVQKCPANETEWNKAAQRKNCSEIQKNDNCTNVEYHCLVNELRNNFIEVCTESRIIRKGMYSLNAIYKYGYIQIIYSIKKLLYNALCSVQTNIYL